MKIWIDCRMYSTNFTWIWRYVYELISYLAKNDQENEYVLFFNEPHYTSFELPNPKWKKVLANTRHYTVKEQTVFLYKLLKEKLDLMHFTHFNAPILYKKPFVVTIHDLTLSFYPGKKMTRSYHRFGYNLTINKVVKNAMKIIAVSEHTKKDIIEILNIPEEKISVIYEGIKKEEFMRPSQEDIDNQKLKFNIKNEYIYYTWVLREHKNLVRLIKAYAELVEEWLEEDLVITWKEDYTYFEVRDMIIAKKLQWRIHLPWFVTNKELVGFYAWSRAFVFPSLYEWFWLPVLEAMATWTPIACSNISSIPEIAWENWAVFFNPLSIESIKQWIRTVLHDKLIRDMLIKNWYKRIEDFKWENMWKEILELYINTK
ncbi:MAG: glycosyl transferase group 1 [uncultured bacterium (gcode 4)]|uniref:Glycosyl transferase group 1 n=1 Tax=uncultured bacterium (gcode 4) TaxID=1234023 RepID=K2H1S2_9BACT|nr:MAG: glycosyl transferase group 1 [uncultured bacterium (gcode 4)]